MEISHDYFSHTHRQSQIKPEKLSFVVKSESETEIKRNKQLLSLFYLPLRREAINWYSTKHNILILLFALIFCVVTGANDDDDKSKRV